MAIFGRSTPFEFLVVGLGNPGKQYVKTRHNVGEEVVNLLATRAGATFKAGRDRALVAETTVAGHRCVLAFPTTYMNDSGQAVGPMMRRYGIAVDHLIVVHDELDLPPAQIRVKVGGGLAGNNGLRSITQVLDSQDYLRVRIGIGKPPNKDRGAAHVLSRMSKADREAMDVGIQIAADAVESLIADGPDVAQRTFNVR